MTEEFDSRDYDTSDVGDSLRKYQEVTAATAMYPGAVLGNIDSINYLTLGLTGEAGEIANKVKEISRDNDGVITDEHRHTILAEAGDVFWYLARLCDELGGDLAVVAQANIDKLLDRRERDVLGGSGDNR